MFYINCLCITVALVIILDLSGFMDSVKTWIKMFLTKGKMRDNNYRMKPFDCSFCMSHHINVIVMFIMGAASLPNYLYILLLSFLTPRIKDVLVFIDSLLNKLLFSLIRKLNE